MRTGRCKFCDQKKQMARAHLIPQGLYPKLRNQNPHYIYRTDCDNERKSPSGLYDLELLCIDCDQKFGCYDQYAIENLKPWPSRDQLLRDHNGFISKGSNTRFSGYKIKNINTIRLQKFAASLVWRCQYTIRDEFAISGPESLVEKCAKMLNDRDSNLELGILAKRLDDKILSQFVARPTHFQGDHGKGIEFNFCGFILNVLENKPNETSPVVLGNTKDWWIRFEPFWGSKYQQSLQKIVDIREQKAA